jgi:hypothetical protein
VSRPPTRVDDVIGALVDAFTAAMPTVTVVDGHIRSVEIEGKAGVVAVGYRRDTFDAAASQVVPMDGHGPTASRPAVEAFTVFCAAAATAGEPEIRPVRARVRQLLDAVQDALAGDPTLGGVVQRVHVGDALQLDSGPYLHNGGGRGAFAHLAFDVQGTVILQ